jgi:hypothetical protein
MMLIVTALVVAGVDGVVVGEVGVLDEPPPYPPPPQPVAAMSATVAARTFSVAFVRTSSCNGIHEEASAVPDFGPVFTRVSCQRRLLQP